MHTVAGSAARHWPFLVLWGAVHSDMEDKCIWPISAMGTFLHTFASAEYRITLRCYYPHHVPHYRSAVGMFRTNVPCCAEHRILYRCAA